MQAARNEIVAWAGRQFDPSVVDAFLSVPTSAWERLHNEISSENHRFCYSEHLSQQQSG
jgi:HD-GYP domain-containing protein (c-di-GMP phosphodiesterase class II)